jgi:uncharacterized protein YbaA (DUF1428 family)|tara:strand:+ start:236 stop:463 length:228 start_codon:yes stop_codon:yes gene_type:complete
MKKQVIIDPVRPDALVDVNKAKREAMKEKLAVDINEYLARGGGITVCEAGARTEDIPQGQWTRNRRRVKPPTPVE